MRELRQLRDGAGLGHAELAARAHFPYDSIRAAEVGPALPDLPVLSAYVRGCGGTTEEWEERWRSLTRTPSLPVSASRNAGNSDAATAGARIGSVSQVGDNPDPSIIIAALNRVAEEMASPEASPEASPDASAAPSPSAVAAVDDFPAAEAPLPTGSGAAPAETAAFQAESEAYQPVPEPATDNKPAGWDPIRVSTAWPVLRDTLPAVTEPANGARPARAKRAGRAGRAESPDRTGLSSSPELSSGTEPAGISGFSGGTGLGVPWGTPPWTEDALDAASPTPGTGQPAPQAGGQAANARVSPAAPAAGGGTARSVSLTRIAVLAAVLLCVLAVLLAVFA
ncbi:MAG TPA: helix-turn-helix domain-containing protein [Trebonia sp.]